MSALSSHRRPPKSKKPRRAKSPPPQNKKADEITCSKCSLVLPRASFSLNQHKKPVSSRTCRTCTSAAVDAKVAADKKKSQSLVQSGVLLQSVMNDCKVKFYVVENARVPENGRKTSPAMREKVKRLDEAYDALAADLLASGTRLGGEKMVGVDCEGTDASRFEALPNRAGCQMIQVSGPTVVVVECVTDKRGAGRGKAAGLSDRLRGLLIDPGVTKAFCDAKGDVKGLNAEMDGNEVRGAHGTVVNVADVQTMAREKGADAKKAGLAQVVSFAVGFTVTKLSIKKKGWWRLRNVEAMVREEGFLEYAAADAWGTWLAHVYLAREEGLGRLAGVEELKRELGSPSRPPPGMGARWVADLEDNLNKAEAERELEGADMPSLTEPANPNPTGNRIVSVNQSPVRVSGVRVVASGVRVVASPVLVLPNQRMANGKHRHIGSLNRTELMSLGWSGTTNFSHSQKVWVPYISGYDSDSDLEYEPVVVRA